MTVRRPQGRWGRGGGGRTRKQAAVLTRWSCGANLNRLNNRRALIVADEDLTLFLAKQRSGIINGFLLSVGPWKYGVSARPLDRLPGAAEPHDWTNLDHAHFE
jgi:hypothetical protein